MPTVMMIDIKHRFSFGKWFMKKKDSILTAAILSYFILAEYSQECVQDQIINFTHKRRKHKIA